MKRPEKGVVMQDKETLRDKAKKLWEENPLETLMAGGAAMAGAAKLIDALSGIRSKNAYAKRMKRR